MNLPGSRLLEAVSKGMLSETSQRFLWTRKGLRFIYCFKELVVSSLGRWEKVRGSTCSAVLTFEMPSMILLSWWLISQHKGRGPGCRTDAKTVYTVLYVLHLYCGPDGDKVNRLVWEWAGRGWLQKVCSVGVQLSASPLLLCQHWDGINQDRVGGEWNLLN